MSNLFGGRQKPFQRLTPNAGNRRFVKGGKMPAKRGPLGTAVADAVDEAPVEPVDERPVPRPRKRASGKERA